MDSLLAGEYDDTGWLPFLPNIRNNVQNYFLHFLAPVFMSRAVLRAARVHGIREKLRKLQDKLWPNVLLGSVVCRIVRL